MHLKPFLACSFKVACFFSFFVAFHFLDFFILKEKNIFEENLNLGYDKMINLPSFYYTYYTTTFICKLIFHQLHIDYSILIIIICVLRHSLAPSITIGLISH
jgi:hypothetical protein